MDVKLPDGTIIRNIPDGTTKAELTAKLTANGYEFGETSQPAVQPPSVAEQPPVQNTTAADNGLQVTDKGLSTISDRAANIAVDRGVENFQNPQVRPEPPESVRECAFCCSLKLMVVCAARVSAKQRSTLFYLLVLRLKGPCLN